MYIHLGGEKIIRASEIVAIFDISIERQAEDTGQFMEHCRKNKRMETIGDEEPKSIVVTTDKVYYSPVSSATLKRRTTRLTV
ncbi:MAG TPA: extracellular matrix/biofilm biosynthesis regulator RemA family protein [Paenibacillaceae bacterium]